MEKNVSADANPHCSRISRCHRKCGERLRFAVENLEDSYQPYDLQNFIDSPGEIEQLQAAALTPNGDQRTDQFADAGAVDIRHSFHVQNKILLALGNQGADTVTQQS